jgi:hypothetical protein
MQLFKQINYEALNEDARLKRQIRDRTFKQVAAFTQLSAEQIKPSYGVDAQNTFDKIFNNFSSVLSQAIDDYLVNDNRINASDVIRSYNNLSSFINAKMGFKELSLTQRDYITKKMNSTMVNVSTLLRNAQAADYTDKIEVKSLLDQLVSKTYNTVGYATIRPEFLDLRGLISRGRDLITNLKNIENKQFFEKGEESYLKTSSDKLDEIEILITDNKLITYNLKRQLDIKQKVILEQLVAILTNLLGLIESRKASVKKSISDYTKYQYELSQFGRLATVLYESKRKLSDKIYETNIKIERLVSEALEGTRGYYIEKTQTNFTKVLNEGLDLLKEAKLVYEKVVRNTVTAESAIERGKLALPRSMQSINAFTYANENPDPGFAADSDNIVIQDLGPTPSFSGRKRETKKQKGREAQAVPAAPPVREASAQQASAQQASAQQASAQQARKFDDESDEDPLLSGEQLGFGLRSHPSYRKVAKNDISARQASENPYLRMFAR